jgi:sugar phosphate isomerase/epimerase
VSTHLYHGSPLRRDHLIEIGAFGFRAVEVFATRSHFDYHSPAAVADLQQWLAEAGLELHSVHAPPGLEQVDEVEQALFVARRIPVKVLVMHLEGTRDLARRRVERIAQLAEPLGVTVAIEASDLSRPGAALHFVEEEIEAAVGICLDFGRAHRAGDLIDALEVVSEHLVAVRLPVESTIEWPSALTTVQKIGYEGALIFEVEPHGSTKETLARAKAARENMERWLTST